MRCIDEVRLHHNDVISGTEALLLTLDVVDASDLPYAECDIDNDGDMEDTDVLMILSITDTLES